MKKHKYRVRVMPIGGVSFIIDKIIGASEVYQRDNRVYLGNKSTGISGSSYDIIASFPSQYTIYELVEEDIT